MKPKQMQISAFKAKCLEIVETLPEDGLVLTKRGEPIAKVLPIRRLNPFERFYGSMKNEIKVKGDIFTTGIKWNAES